MLQNLIYRSITCVHISKFDHFSVKKNEIATEERQEAGVENALIVRQYRRIIHETPGKVAELPLSGCRKSELARILVNLEGA
eukprot:SAG11_NODE_784_length_7187_cov_2.920429_5_plen_82_part_00